MCKEDFTDYGNDVIINNDVKNLLGNEHKSLLRNFEIKLV